MEEQLKKLIKFLIKEELSKGKNILLLVHPDIIFENGSTDELQKYFKKIQDDVARFDHVITHLFYSPKFEPETFNNDYTYNEIFKNFLKMLKEESDVIKFDDPKYQASFSNELPSYLIDNPNSTIFLAGGYANLCVKMTYEMAKEKIGDVILETNTKFVCYLPLLIKYRGERIVEAAFNKKLLRNMGYEYVDRNRRIGSDTFIHAKDDNNSRYHKRLIKRINKNLNKGSYYRSKKRDTLKDPPAMGISWTKGEKG